MVGPDRADKLIGALIKSTSKETGIALPRSAIEMPTEADGQSKGFMFITLANPTEASVFQRALHDFKFDKRHTFRVVPFADVGNFEHLEEEYVEPPSEEWQPRVSPLFGVGSPTRRARKLTLRPDHYRSTSAPGSSPR